MTITTFKSSGDTYKITVEPAKSDGKKYPLIVLVHGNSGMGPPFGAQITAFATKLAAKGYNTAVPRFYVDNAPHLADTIPKQDILADAIHAVASIPSVDDSRIGLVGFSLGATTAMSFIAQNAPGKVMVLADFFGFLTTSITSAVAKFPPTIIFHNKRDQIVDVQNSKKLDQLLPHSVEHQFIEYDEQYLKVNHSFEPGEPADVDSQNKTIGWCVTHLPPSGV